MKELMLKVSEFIQKEHSDKEIIDFIVENHTDNSFDYMFSFAVRESKFFKKFESLLLKGGSVLSNDNINLIIEFSNMDRRVLSVVESCFERSEKTIRDNAGSFMSLVFSIKNEYSNCKRNTFKNTKDLVSRQAEEFYGEILKRKDEEISKLKDMNRDAEILFAKSIIEKEKEIAALKEKIINSDKNVKVSLVY